MRVNLLRAFSVLVALIVLAVAMPSATAQYWVSFDDHTRYIALGDSLTAGYGAHPADQGFTYRLYQANVIDNTNHTLFCNAGVSGITSEDLLMYQVPQVARFFSNTGKPYGKVVTLTVGGNDMLQILEGADPTEVLNNFGTNLFLILTALTTKFPDVRIYMANQYDPMLPVPCEELLVGALNDVVSNVAQYFQVNVVLVDVFRAFQGKSGLLLIERKGSGFQVHPSNAGYNVMAMAFADAIRAR